MKRLDKKDPHSSERKADHIRLALESQIRVNDDRFYYEPILSGHPQGNLPEIEMFGKTFRAPVWVSSMTGGTEKAGDINRRLAIACGKYGMGMGLGSCRMLLQDDTYLADFQLRKYIGDDGALFTNLGIAQIEELIASSKLNLINELIDKTETDGLIIHVNPMQEFLQPEGDQIAKSPLDSIKRVLDSLDHPIIVKEVGQGMGPASLKALSELPLAAIDFGAFGGTNFSRMELKRHDGSHSGYDVLSHVGHTAVEMIQFYNEIIEEKKGQCPPVIISGGIRDFLDGYYAINKVNCQAIYGQASAFLKKALEGQEPLDRHIESEIRGLNLVGSMLRIKE